MKKEKILENLKTKCKKLLEENESASKKRVYQSIMNILNSPDAFNFIDIGTSLNILADLGYSKAEALKLYGILVA